MGFAAKWKSFVKAWFPSPFGTDDEIAAIVAEIHARDIRDKHNEFARELFLSVVSRPDMQMQTPEQIRSTLELCHSLADLWDDDIIRRNKKPETP